MKKTDRELFVSDMVFGKLTTEDNLLTLKILSGYTLKKFHHKIQVSDMTA